jgi:hypothetical protein
MFNDMTHQAVRKKTWNFGIDLWLPEDHLPDSGLSNTSQDSICPVKCLKRTGYLQALQASSVNNQNS